MGAVGALVAALCSVACEPAGDPAVIGATAPEAAVVRAVIEDFRAEVVPELAPVVRRVVFRDLADDDALGAYRPVLGGGRGVLVFRPGLDLDFLALAVRHELCHALDFRGRLSVTSDWPVLEAVPVARDTAEHHRAELFAYLCMLGPEGVALLHDVAGDCLPDGVDDVTWTLLEDVFAADRVAPPEVMPASTHGILWPANEPWRLAQVVGWRDPHELWVLAPHRERRDRWRFVALDLDREDWATTEARTAWSSTSRLLGRDEAVGTVRWVDARHALPGGQEVLVRSTLLPWGGKVAVVATDTEPRVHAGACLPGDGTLAVWERAVAAEVQPNHLSWVELTPVFDAVYGEGWRGAPGSP